MTSLCTYLCQQRDKCKYKNSRAFFVTTVGSDNSSEIKQNTAKLATYI